jgi:hypothetical protein
MLRYRRVEHFLSGVGDNVLVKASLQRDPPFTFINLKVRAFVF